MCRYLAPSTPTIPPVPPATATETEISKAYLAYLKVMVANMAEDREQAARMWPVILRSMGYQEDPDTGEITELPPSELEALYEERQIQALKGELPLSPGLEQELASQRELSQEELARRGAEPGTTPYIQTEARQAESAGLLREASRYGQITLGEQLMSSQASRAALQTRGLWQAQQGGLGGGGTGGLGGFQGALQPFQWQRGLQYQRGAAQAGIQAQRNAALMQLYGQAGMMALSYGGMAAAGAAWSSKDFKKDIEKIDNEIILKKLKDSDIYEYRFKTESDTSKKHLGFIAEYAPEEIATEDRKAVMIPDWLGFITSALKALVSKVEKLEEAKTA